MEVKFEIDGRPVDPNRIEDSITAAVLKSVAEKVRSQIGSIRHPETGEFPIVVVRGHSLDKLSIEITGSPELLELVNERLYGTESEQVVISENAGEATETKPVAFLCHASEDKEVVRKLATDLVNKGIDVFFDEWEILAGDSIRRKIDEGLGRCSHFISILTPQSITKEWVQIEIDAGFVQRIEGRCKFIPARIGLPVERLTPLLRSLHSPSLDDYEPAVAQLISDIHGTCRKPQLGSPPAVVARQTGGLGISAAAGDLVRLMVERSEHGDSMDPQLSPDDIREATGLPDDDIVDAIDELEGQGFVKRHISFGCGEIGFHALTPESDLFSKFDRHFKPWNPEDDALLLAADLVNREEDGLMVKAIAESYQWLPRRMNPAVNYLINRELVVSSEAMGCYPWTTPWIRKTPATRRFVRDRSQTTNQ